MATKETAQFGVLVDGKWTGEWTRPVALSPTTTLATLRAPSRYWVISDAQLKRDLRGRTLADVYRENKTGRYTNEKYTPRQQVTAWNSSRREYEEVTVGGLGDRPGEIAAEYRAWCKAKGHTPHPASIDSSHPWNVHREKAPRREATA